MAAPSSQREGSLEAPTRHPIDWRNPEFFDEGKLFAELERVYDICHGCRRCVSLCQSFPTLFDLVDESSTLEVDGVDKKDYWKVVDHCYLCDLCYMTKCPYVPPHEWNVDFPHLMLRAKAVKFRKGKTSFRDRVITSTDTVGKYASLPVVANVVNGANKNPIARDMLHDWMGIHRKARLPEYHSETFEKFMRTRRSRLSSEPEPVGRTQGKVAFFSTCYGNYNSPHINADFVAVFEHNGIPVKRVSRERCCGMPKLELGDLASVQKAKEENIPTLVRVIDDGWDIVAPIPSCVLMFKQEIPLMFPDEADVQKVKAHIFDPFEYLMHRHKAGKLDTDFKNPLGKVAYHVACHQRVQNIGAKTKEVLSLVPETTVTAIERCSGHDGTYAVKKESHDASMKIVKPVVNRIKQAEADHYGSDCPMAATHIANGLADGKEPEHPMSLLRRAYGI